MNRQLKIDVNAKEIAFNRWALSSCVHMPVAAISENAIEEYIGNIIKIIRPGSPTKALLVEVPSPPPLDTTLPIWNHARSFILHQRMQVWVRANYNGYRGAYKRAFPSEPIDGLVLSHCTNRRHAALKGFEYVRIVPASRSVNSSCAFSQNWGIETYSKPSELASFKKREIHIQYTDLVDLMAMLDMPPKGGFVDAVNEAQWLVTPA